MKDDIFSKLLQAHQDVRRAHAASETRQFILWMAVLCGIGIIAIQLMGV